LQRQENQPVSLLVAALVQAPDEEQKARTGENQAYENREY
jgi:hypothetical protein